MVGDVKTWHYKVKFNLPEFKKLVVGVSKIVAKDAITMENIEKSFDEAMGNVKNMEGELWIGKKDYLLYKMFADVEVSESKSKSNYSFALSLFFSNYNQAVNIEAPTDTISLADLIQKSLEDARKKAEDAMKVSNVKQLQLAAELYFDAKGYYPKTSDVQVLFKEFEKQKILTFSGQPSETFPESGGFYCSRQNGKSYVLGVTLNDSSASFLNSDLDGKFVCDDKKTVDCADPVYCTGLQ